MKAAPMAETRRVALLARPGEACERLRAALREAGGEIVLEADPSALTPEALSAAAPQAVLVALDPAVEDALDRFESVFGDPAIAVIFDEADLAAKREGWDAARWVRHLAAKLHQHGDVLPPGRDPDDDMPDESLLEKNVELQPGRPITPEQRHADAQFAPFADEAASVAATVPTEPQPGVVEPGALQLTDDIDAMSLAADTSSDTASDVRFKHDIADLERRISSMELVGEAVARGPDLPRGAVLILAGIGGPDAVRQLLAGLPEGFARPILINQRLDGGRHDRLVQQMARATALPVHLAKAGTIAVAGEVYIMPPELGLADTDDGLRFDAGVPLLASLPASDSAVLLLSGSDPADVDTALGLAARGALIAGQSPEGCYDAAAPNALIARGGNAGSPTDMVKQLLQRWPA
jgi:chemosensory pili system protein ChpB (putative protein-glutamate methylesterase)